MSELITPELVSLDRAARRPTGGRDPCARRSRRVTGRAIDAAALAADALAREQTEDATGHPRRHRDPPLRLRVRHGGDARLRAASSPVSTSAPPTAPPTSCSSSRRPRGPTTRTSPCSRGSRGRSCATGLHRRPSLRRVAGGRRRPRQARGARMPRRPPPRRLRPLSPQLQAPTTAPGTARRTGIRARIVAVTACATGIAHTFMAADALTAAGQKSRRRVDQSSRRARAATTPLPPVGDRRGAMPSSSPWTSMCATGSDSPESRSCGFPSRSGIDAAAAADRAEAAAAVGDPSAPRVGGTAAAAAESTAATRVVGASVKRALLTGVSYMIPFVAGGGLLIATRLPARAGTPSRSGMKAEATTRPTCCRTSRCGTFRPRASGTTSVPRPSRSVGCRSASSSRPLPGTSRTGSPTAPASHPASSAGAVAAAFMNAGFLGGLVGGLLARSSPRWWLTSPAAALAARAHARRDHPAAGLALRRRPHARSSSAGRWRG